MRSRGNRAAVVQAAALAVLTVGMGHHAWGATGTWTGAGPDNLWSTPANWLGSVPGSNVGLVGSNADTAFFTGTPTTGNVTVDLNRNIGNITIDAIDTTTT